MQAMKEIKIPNSFIINKYPLYFGWTPTRNVDGLIRTLQNDIDDIKELLKKLVENKEN